MFYRQKPVWSLENLVSYQVVDRVVWMSLESTINHFRVHHLGLAPVRMLLGEGGWNLVDALQVLCDRVYPTCQPTLSTPPFNPPS